MPPTQPRIFGFLMPLLSGADHLRLLSGARRAAYEAGCTMVVYHAGLETNVGSASDLFVENRLPLVREIDGWIVSTAAHSADWARAMQPTQKPIVLISPAAQIAGYARVIPDNVQGMYLATTHLIGLGHTRIAFVGHTPNSDIAERYAGYQQALREHGLPLDPDLVCTTIDWRREYWSALAGAEAVQQLRAQDVPFTAIAAATDELAAGAIGALRELGLRLPDDCAVTGFDDAPIALTTEPPLTTVRQSFRDLGRTAVQVLLDVFADPQRANTTVLVPTSLIVRSSCGSTPGWAHQILPRDTTLPIADQLIDVLDTPATPEIVGAVHDLVQSHATALASGEDRPWINMLQRRLPEIVGGRHIDPTRVQQALELLRGIPHDAAPGRADHLSAMAQRALPVAYAQTATMREFRHAETLDLNNVLLDLFRIDRETLVSLAWMRETIVRNAWLYLRDPASPERLTLAGQYDAVPNDLPPAALASIVGLADEREELLLSIFTVRVNGTPSGLCVLRVHERDLSQITNTAGVWIALIETRLAMDLLLSSLRESRDSLAASVDIERTLAATVRELGVPVMPVADGVVVLPLIGAIDGARGERIIEGLLEAVAQRAAHTVVIDITGVPIVDTYVAGSLVRAARAVRLLGASVVLTGIRPEVAQTLVQLGVSFSDFATRATLQDGLRSVLTRASR